LSDPLKVVADTNSRPSSLDPDASMEAHQAANFEEGVQPTPPDDKPPVNEEGKQLALAIANAADDRKAGNIAILQTGDVSYLADYFVIMTGFSKVQVRAIANSIDSAVEDTFERMPLRREGMSEGRWVLLDYGDVIAHIFMPDDREYYDLDAFWGHAERIEFVPTPAT